MKRMIIKIKLFLVRKIRVIRIIYPKSDVLLYGLLILLWMIFGLVSKYIADFHGDESITYLRTIWNLRNSIFTSVVLTFSIGAFNRLRDYRRLLKRQHFLYVDSMDDFKSVKELVDELYFILEELRFIWRRDLKLDMELLKMDQNPQENFYQRMWLEEFDIEMARNWEGEKYL